MYFHAAERFASGVGVADDQKTVAKGGEYLLLCLARADNRPDVHRDSVIHVHVQQSVLMEATDTE